MALIDADEEGHELCRAALGYLELPLVAPWPALTEAMHLLSHAGGSTARQALWRLVLSDRLRLPDLPRSAVERSAELMAKYAGLPMDLADATLVAIAEERGTGRVFTLDADFRVYRRHGRLPFDVVPAARR